MKHWGKRKKRNRITNIMKITVRLHNAKETEETEIQVARAKTKDGRKKMKVMHLSLMISQGNHLCNSCGSEQDRAKGNKQEAKYQNQEIMLKKLSAKYWRNVRREIESRTL